MTRWDIFANGCMVQNGTNTNPVSQKVMRATVEKNMRDYELAIQIRGNKMIEKHLS